MAGSCLVIDDFAKVFLRGQLRWTRRALVWNLDGLSGYDGEDRAVSNPDLVAARP